MILFLDIDGVLHPNPSPIEQAFCQRHLIWQLLEARPNLRVVITSDWRLHHPLPDIIEFIMEDCPTRLHERIIGSTPQILEAQYEYRGRERECLLWLATHAQSDPDWIALDDVASNYTFGSQQLVMTDYRTGITELILEKLFLRIPGPIG